MYFIFLFQNIRRYAFKIFDFNRKDKSFAYFLRSLLYRKKEKILRRVQKKDTKLTAYPVSLLRIFFVFVCFRFLYPLKTTKMKKYTNFVQKQNYENYEIEKNKKLTLLQKDILFGVILGDAHL